jgi:predicted RNA-binding protein Jag
MQPENAKKIIEEVFTLLGLPAESVTYTSDEKRGHIFSVKSAEFEKAAAIKVELTKDTVYLLKRIFNKDSKFGEEMFKCTIDINNEQSKVDEKIKEKALAAAEQARNLKTDVEMEPMSSYERMVVHSTLAGIPDISTESVGIGRERRLKVKYLAI